MFRLTSCKFLKLIGKRVITIKYVVCRQLIQFLVSVVGNQKHQLNTGLKRKAPLMLADATSGPQPVKIARDRSGEKLYQVQSVCFIQSLYFITLTETLCQQVIYVINCIN